jgi:hypothetical protein
LISSATIPTVTSPGKDAAVLGPELDLAIDLVAQFVRGGVRRAARAGGHPRHRRRGRPRPHRQAQAATTAELDEDGDLVGA